MRAVNFAKVVAMLPHLLPRPEARIVVDAHGCVKTMRTRIHWNY